MLYFLKNMLYGLVLLILISVSYAANSETYKDTINKNQQILEMQGFLYKSLVERNQEQILKLEPEHKLIINQAEQAYKENATNINAEEAREGSILEKVIENIKNLDVQTNNSKNKDIIIFISFSMAPNLLWSYQEQARRYGARLVIRGLVDNSFKKTIQAMDLGNGRIMKLDINPMLFKDYGITKVPSIVIVDELTSNKLEDKFIGSISLKHALEESSIHGDQKEFSLWKLKQLSVGRK